MTFPVVLAESGYSKSEIYHQNNSWNDLKLVTWIQDCLPVQRMTERAFFLKTQGCSSHLFIWPACISSWDQETGGRFVAGYCFLVQICKVRVETSLGYRRCSASGWNTAGFSDSSILPITASTLALMASNPLKKRNMQSFRKYVLLQRSKQ